MAGFIWRCSPTTRSELPSVSLFRFFFNDTATTEIYTLSLHDALPIFGTGELDDEVRAETAVFGRHMRLRLEVAVLEHPGHLDDPPELDLAPAPADVGPVAQGTHQVSGLAAELALSLRELADLDAQLGVRVRARDLELLEFSVDLLQRLGDRRHEMLDRLLPLLQLLGRPLLQLLQLRLGEFHEGLVVRRKGVCGERLQGGAERRPGFFERAHATRVLSPQHEPGCCRADEETDDESDDHLGRRTLEIGSDNTRRDH